MRAPPLFALVLLACSSDPAGSDVSTSGGIPGVDASGGGTPVRPDSGTTSSGGPVDSGSSDKTPPLGIDDLDANVVSHTAIALTWTAPSDPPGGNVSSYEIRRSKASIANDVEFAAATAVTAPTPKAAGASESFTATGLDPETTYYFAVRAKDAAGNAGPISNIASATTKARATLLLSEVAMANATGTDFVELVATKAGNVKDIAVRQSNTPQVLHTFADFDVAQGDRIVVHLTGLPGPSGFAQEDATKSKTSSTETAAFASDGAWDVYSAVSGTGLAATDLLVTLVDGTTILDAVAYSGRDGDAAAASMTAFANAKAANAWSFTATPADGVNDCATQREAVAVSTSLGNGTCGRFASGIGVGKTINRIGTTDTNAKKDWYVAAQTPGAENAPIPAPAWSGATATSLTTVEVRFNQEIDAGTVTAGAFTGSGITINAATLTEPTVITLTTSSQGGPHDIGIGPALKTIYGASVTTTFQFCGYEPLGGMLAFTEINPTIPGSAGELIELQATRSGALDNFIVRINATAASPNGTNLATFPQGSCVAAGDIVVVHVDPPAVLVGQTEIAEKDQYSTANFSAHFDGAWDVRGTTTALPNSDCVVFLRNAAGTYVDAVAYTNGNGDHAENASFVASLQYAQSLALWQPATCGGVSCDASSTPTAEAVSASIAGISSTVGGASLRKPNIGDPPTAASWSVGPSSWGQAN